MTQLGSKKKKKKKAGIHYALDPENTEKVIVTEYLLHARHCVYYLL
jgi:hypothetical protein